MRFTQCSEKTCTCTSIVTDAGHVGLGALTNRFDLDDSLSAFSRRFRTTPDHVYATVWVDCLIAAAGL